MSRNFEHPHFDAQQDRVKLARALSYIYRRVRSGDESVIVGPKPQGGAFKDQMERMGLFTAEMLGIDDPALQMVFVEHANTQSGQIIPTDFLTPPTKKLRVAIAGAGIVGGGLIKRLLMEPGHFEIAGVLVRTPDKYTQLKDAGLDLIVDPDQLQAMEVDIFAEAMGGSEPALSLMRHFLSHGTHVVSANKQAMAAHLLELQQLAKQNSTTLSYSAAVGGGTPMIEILRWLARQDNDIVEIEALLNGTVNFMLTCMQRGQSYEQALAKAQAMGYAEADPTEDVMGLDARAKLALLCYEAFGELPENTHIDQAGLTPVTARKVAGARSPWRQVASAMKIDGKLVAKVELKQVDPFSVMGRTIDVYGALVAITDNGERHVIIGRGAGREPTSRSMFADICDRFL